MKLQITVSIIALIACVAISITSTRRKMIAKKVKTDVASTNLSVSALSIKTDCSINRSDVLTAAPTSFPFICGWSPPKGSKEKYRSVNLNCKKQVASTSKSLSESSTASASVTFVCTKSAESKKKFSEDFWKPIGDYETNYFSDDAAKKAKAIASKAK